MLLERLEVSSEDASASIEYEKAVMDIGGIVESYGYDIQEDVDINGKKRELFITIEIRIITLNI